MDEGAFGQQVLWWLEHASWHERVFKSASGDWNIRKADKNVLWKLCRLILNKLRLLDGEVVSINYLNGVSASFVIWKLGAFDLYSIIFGRIVHIDAWSLVSIIVWETRVNQLKVRICETLYDSTRWYGIVFLCFDIAQICISFIILINDPPFHSIVMNEFWLHEIELASGNFESATLVSTVGY